MLSNFCPPFLTWLCKFLLTISYSIFQQLHIESRFPECILPDRLCASLCQLVCIWKWMRPAFCGSSLGELLFERAAHSAAKSTTACMPSTSRVEFQLECVSNREWERARLFLLVISTARVCTWWRARSLPTRHFTRTPPEDPILRNGRVCRQAARGRHSQRYAFWRIPCVRVVGRTEWRHVLLAGALEWVRVRMHSAHMLSMRTQKPFRIVLGGGRRSREWHSGTLLNASNGIWFY